MELLIELFWEVRENKHLAEMPLPLALFFNTSSVVISFGATARGRQQAILAYFDFPVISLKNDVIVVKVGGAGGLG